MTEVASDRPRDLLVSGHVNVDRFLRVSSFPLADRTVPVHAQSVALGGPATTLARVATSLGVATGLVSRIGSDFPAEFLRRLASGKIDLRGVEKVADQGTPTCYIVEDHDGRQRTLIDQGPMGNVRGARYPGPWLKEYSWLHVATGDPFYSLGLIARAVKGGLKVAVDPAQEIFYRWDAPRFRRLLSNAEILFGNRAEIAHAIRLSGGGGVPRLLERVPLVVRTEGSDGATAFSRAATYHVSSRRARKVRTFVGAGDAFRGGFYSAWFHGSPLRDCLEAGTRSSTRWIERGL